MATVTGFEIVSDELIGQGGFLTIRRVRLKNVRDDGSRSSQYLVDFLDRPKGLDAVVVALWHRAADGRVLVLLRAGLRPSLPLARTGAALTVPDRREYLFFKEVVAGIVERQDHGEAGLRHRAALEVHEEAGYRVSPAQVQLLGAGTFPSAGAFPERFFLAAVEIDDPGAREEPPGDGSPMEEGSTIEWLELDEAIAACVRGDIEDAKTELTLRRLKDALGS